MGEPSSLTWEGASSFAELCEANIRFIRGELDESPTHGPIDSETNEIAMSLIELNRSGWLTTASQPAVSGGSFQQRAWVEGWAMEAMALTIAEKQLYSDLVIRVFRPGGNCGDCLAVPITQYGGRPHTWAGYSGEDDLEHFARVCTRPALDELRLAWYVIAVDPTWGRSDHLWRTLLEPRRAGYSMEPHPDHGSKE